MAPRSRGGRRGGGRGGGRGGRSGGKRGGRVSKGRGRKPFGAGSSKTGSDAPENMNLEISIDDVRALFLHSTSFDQHRDSQTHDPARYQAALLVLIEHKLELSSGSKARALAAAIARHDHDLTRMMLKLPDVFGMVEVTKALSMLDANRQLKRNEARLAKLTDLKETKEHKVKNSKFAKLKSTIGNLQSLKVKGSLSGAVARQIQRWTITIPKDELEFYALHYPKEPWKAVADLCHLNPKKHFQLDWFLPYCFGADAPEGSLAYQCSQLTKENLNEVLQTVNIPYAYLKKLKDWFDDDTKKLIATNQDLSTIIWWFEDLQCKGVNEIIETKLDAGEKIKFSYGKLMERIFTLRSKAPPKLVNKLMSLAETNLREISLTLESPIAVLGDKSASMSVCVKTSNIIASLLAMICDAHINFFDNKLVEPPFYPKDVASVLELSDTIKAGCSTAPAASLLPFYEKKHKINTFIVVTDEEENTSCKSGDHFDTLFTKYADEVHKAKLVFVSFLSSQTDDGQMVKKLKKAGFSELVQQFRFDQSRPDLTKLDHMFAVLSTAGDWFEVEVQQMKAKIEADGLLPAALGKLNLKEDKTTEEGWEYVAADINI